MSAPEEGGAALELLELLGIGDDLPPERRIEALFSRFQAQVPYENASRDDQAPRPPEEVLAGFLESGRGTVAGERAVAFGALAREAGLAVERLAARWSPGEGAEERGEALRFGGEGGLLLDPGLPLPVAVPLESAREYVTGWGRLRLRDAGEELLLLCEARGRTSRLARYGRGREDRGPDGPAGGAAGAAAAVGPGGSSVDSPPHVPGAYARRVLEDRVLELRGGRLRVSDAWSVLDVPAPNPVPVAELLGLELSPAAAGRLSAGVPEAGGASTLTVFHRADALPDSLLGRLATSDGYLSILPPGLEAAQTREEEGGFAWTLTARGAFLRRERIVREAGGIRVELLEGELPFSSRRYRLEPDAEATVLSVRADLLGEVPRSGLAETVRRTLVFHLATELLALASA